MSAQKLKTAKNETTTFTGAGSVIPGYSILARLGRGGMGAVFKALQLSMNRLVALKILPISLAKDRIYIRRFLREAKSAAQMNHPNLTRVYDVGSYRGVFYFSMEFVEGATLLDLIRSEHRLDAETAIDITLQAARGLRHAHSHSIVHRDIKPENIMIATDGAVKVTDMGLAKRMDAADHDITVTGQVIGTPCYMSPEQITAPKFIDHRCDIYSLGATLYHMVTGEKPFQGESSPQTMLMVVGEEPEWPRGRVPVPILRVIKKMMAKDPARRYQTTDELINELIYLKEKFFTPHRSRRLLRSAAAATSPAAAPAGQAAAIIETPSRTLTLILALAAFLAVLAAVVLRAGREAEPAPAAWRTSQIPEARPGTGLSADKYFEKGKARAVLGRWEQALTYFDAAVKAGPGRHDAWNNRGTCLWHLGRFEEALKSYDRALEENPGSADTYINRGATLLEMRKPEQALEEFETALRQAPGSHAAWWGKAVALRRLGRATEAAKAQLKARALKK